MSKTWPQIFAELSAPFPDEEINWKPGALRKDHTAAIALAHLDARAVMDRLDAVVGPENWSDEYERTEISIRKFDKTARDYYYEKEEGIVCKLTVLGVTKSDVGVPSDYESLKGAYSDAFKRAGVKFGIGRYLYNMPANWIAWDDRKKTWAKPLPKEHWKLAGAEPIDIPDPAREYIEISGEFEEVVEQVNDALSEVAENGHVALRDVAELLAAAGYYPDEQKAANAMGRAKEEGYKPLADITVKGDVKITLESATALTLHLISMTIPF